MAHARDAETIGLLFQALVQQHCPTVAIGVKDDPRSRWAEIEELVGRLQLAAQAAEPPRDGDTTWEEMTEQERAAWLRNAQITPD